MTSHIVKGFPLFRDKKPIDLPIANLVDLPAQAMADFLSKGIIYPQGYAHRFSILFLVFQPLPAHQAAYPHNGARERATGFPLSGHTSGQGTSGLKDILASHIQFVLQSCKNGLGSTEIVHVILKGQFEDLT
jgi:hypothetical protein